MTGEDSRSHVWGSTCRFGHVHDLASPSTIPSMRTGRRRPGAAWATVVLAWLVGSTSVVLAPEAVAQAGPRTVVVTPAGSPSGDGSDARPLSLAAALSARSGLRGGDTVLLRGGKYQGCFVSDLRGAPGAPVIVRQASGERAVIDGRGCPNSTLTVKGSDVWLMGFEVTNSMTARRTSTAGSHPADYVRATGVAVYGPRTKLINLYVHDNGNGIGLWTQAIDAEIYGCVVAHNGWRGPDRGHGHGIYTQNDTGTKLITDSMSLANYGAGFHAYGEAGKVAGYAVDGLVAADNGAPAGSSPTDPLRVPNFFVGSRTNGADRISLTNSQFFQPAGAAGGGVQLGWTETPNGSVTATGNVIAGGAEGMQLLQWSRATVTGNTVHATASRFNSSFSFLGRLRSGAPASTQWNNNRYFDQTGRGGPPFAFNNARSASGAARLSLDEWRRATGADKASTYTAGRPTGAWTQVRPNRYEAGRANVAVFNWDDRPTVNLDLSGVRLVRGQRFTIVNALDLMGSAVASGVWTGAPVAVGLDGVKAVAPFGDAATVPATTGPTFASLIVLPGALPAPASTGGGATASRPAIAAPATTAPPPPSITALAAPKTATTAEPARPGEQATPSLVEPYHPVLTDQRAPSIPLRLLAAALLLLAAGYLYWAMRPRDKTG